MFSILFSDMLLKIFINDIYARKKKNGKKTKRKKGRKKIEELKGEKKRINWLANTCVRVIFEKVGLVLREAG